MPPEQQQVLQDLACGFFFLVPFVPFSGYPIFIQFAFVPSRLTKCRIFVPDLVDCPVVRVTWALRDQNAACCATPRLYPALAPATLAHGPVQTINVHPRLTCFQFLYFASSLVKTT